MRTRPIDDVARACARADLSTQALCRGPLETSVFGVSGSAARGSRGPHIGLRYGRLLMILEDRMALEQLAASVAQALDMATGVFGPPEDAFTEAEREGRARFERTGNAAALR